MTQPIQAVRRPGPLGGAGTVVLEDEALQPERAALDIAARASRELPGETVARQTARAIISVDGLRRSYGDVQAVRGVSFEVPEGTIFGLLGPNGAGKTSILEMIEGIRRPDAGRVILDGLDPFRDARKVRQIIGAHLQATALEDRMRVEEVFELFGTFYDNPMPVDELIEVVRLEHKRSTFIERLSGGEKQRVGLGLALVGNPKVLFLDEPTTGLDVEIRNTLHSLVLDLREQGRTIVLTTHYIEEAERLCDLVGILEHGTLHAIDSPRELIRRTGQGDRLEVSFSDGVTLADCASWLGPGVDITNRGSVYVCRGKSGGKMLADIAVQAHRHDHQVLEASIVHTTLEDVYLKLTGRGITS